VSEDQLAKIDAKLAVVRQIFSRRLWMGVAWGWGMFLAIIPVVAWAVWLTSHGHGAPPLWLTVLTVPGLIVACFCEVRMWLGLRAYGEGQRSYGGYAVNVTLSFASSAGIKPRPERTQSLRVRNGIVQDAHSPVLPMSIVWPCQWPSGR